MQGILEYLGRSCFQTAMGKDLGLIVFVFDVPQLWQILQLDPGTGTQGESRQDT